MKFSYTLVTALVGVAAAGSLGAKSSADESLIEKRFNKGQVDSEAKNLNTLIDDMQKAKDAKKANTNDGWQKNIDQLREVQKAIASAPADKALEEINKLQGPLDHMTKSRDDSNKRRTDSINSLQDAKKKLTDAANAS